jgi:fatty acid desaturase
MSDIPDRLSRDDRAALKALCVPSDAAGLRRLAGHLVLILGAGALVWVCLRYGGWLAALPAQLLLGIALTFLFAPLHETIHRTAFKSRALNDGFAVIAGAILVLPPRWFRAFHLEHHRHTQIEGKDPELDGKRIASQAGYLFHITGLPNWAALIRGLLDRALGKADAPYLEGRVGPRVVAEARAYIAFYAVVAALSVGFETSAAPTYWLVPMLLGQPFLRLYLLAEHVGCPLEADMFRNTRTTLTNPVIRYLAWNMPYHVEHHAFMAVPFHRLPEAHARFKDRIAVLTPGYARFHRDLWRDLAAGRPAAEATR